MGNTRPRSASFFPELVARDAKNMNFKSYRVLFVPEGEVEEAVGKEVMRWKES